MNVTTQEKLDLKKLMDNKDDYEDNTEDIRRVKHSIIIRDNILAIETLKTNLKNQGETDIEIIKKASQDVAPFLYSGYRDIFNKVVSDEIDLGIMSQILTVLKTIEDGKINQEEGSVMVGKLLKTLYIDSAMKHGDNLDKKYEGDKPPPLTTGLSLSWKDYKHTKK
jgi:hypothetical protein